MNKWLRIGIVVAFIVILIIGVFYLRNVFSYIIISGILSLFGRPIMGYLQSLRIGKIHLPNWICAVVTMIFFIFVITLLVSAFVPLLVQQANLIFGIDPNQVISGLSEPLNRLDNWLAQYSFGGGSGISSAEKLQAQLTELLNPNIIPTLFGSVFGVVNNIFTYIIAIFAVTFITFFFLTDKDLLYRLFFSFVPEQFEERFENVVTTSKELLTRYVYGVLMQVTTITVFISTGMMILGMENALLIGLFAGFANIIPYVGPFIGLCFGIFVAITTNLNLEFYTQTLPLILKMGLVFAIMQIIDNMFLQPLIFSNSVKAHPLEIFILILVAGTLAGVPGMILAIPFYTIFRVIAKEFLSEFKVVQHITKNI